MTPPDARVLIVATLIIAGVPVAVHEYRLHAQHRALVHSDVQDASNAWRAGTGGPQDRLQRGDAPIGRPVR